MLLAVAFLHAIAAMAKPSHPVRAPRVSHFADPTVSISQFGAIENIDTIEAATANANAFSMAIHNTSGTGGTVLVPNGTFTMLGHEGAVGISSISIHIIGVISAWANATQWPNDGHKAYYPLIGMSNCSDIRISGPGTIEGNGYLWWWAEILPPFLPYHRPTLVELYSCERVAIGGGLTTRNAPNFNFNMRGMLDLEVSHVTVDTDVFGLATGLRERGALAPLTGEHGKPWHHGMTSDARIALQRRASAVHPLGFDIPTFPLVRTRRIGSDPTTRSKTRHRPKLMNCPIKYTLLHAHFLSCLRRRTRTDLISPGRTSTYTTATSQTSTTPSQLSRRAKPVIIPSASHAREI